MPVYLINSEHIGISEQFCDDQNVPYYQVWLYHFFVSLLNRNIVFSKPQKTSLAEECVYLYTFYPFSWCPKDTRAYHFRRPCPKWSFKRGRAKKKSIIIITYTSAVRDLSQILETISILDSVVIFLDPLRSFTKMAKVQMQTWLDFSAQHIFFNWKLFKDSIYYLPDITVDEKYCETVAVFTITKVNYSRVRNKHSRTLINFLTFFQGLRPYSGLHSIR